MQRRFPPPLPPRPFVPEPFHEVDREGDTLREGMTRDPRDVLIDSLREELAQLQAANDSAPPPTLPSMRKRRAEVVRLFGKWSFLIAGLPLAGGVVTRRWPEYAGLVDVVVECLAAMGLR